MKATANPRLQLTVASMLAHRSRIRTGQQLKRIVRPLDDAKDCFGDAVRAIL